MEKVRALTSHKQTAVITVNATSPTGVTSGVSVEIKALQVRNLTFDVDGDTTAVQPQQIIVDEFASQPQPLTKVGYTLSDWYKEADFQTIWDFHADVMPDQDTTLYATWQAHKYKVVFDANGGTGAMEQAFVYDTAQALTTNTITREGYTFQGWSTTPNGPVVYTDGETVQNLTADDNGVVTLYAVWRVHTYNVAFDANSGTGTMTDQAFVYDTAQALTANTFTKVGYTLAGWSTTPDGLVEYGDGEVVQNLTADDNGIVTLYAVWRVHTYKVVFDANGGTGAMEQAFVYDTAQALATNTITREGYTFEGWSTTPNGQVVYTDGETVQNLTADDNGVVTLYAVWQVHTYNVTFDANSGTGTMTDQAFVYDIPQALTANTFTKEGYMFKGWSTTPNGQAAYTDREAVQNLTADDNGMVTLYAVWEANTHHIEFHANGGTGTMENQVFVYDVSQELTSNAFIKEGHTFLGWSTEPNGQVVYADGEVIQNLTADHNTVITIYGVWKANTYNVAFNANGGTGAMSNQAFVYDAAAQALTENAFTREGYTFKGWSTSPNGQVVYTDGETVQNLTANANGVVTLYAVWEGNALSGTIKTGDDTMKLGIGASVFAVLSAGVMFIARRKKNQDNA